MSKAEIADGLARIFWTVPKIWDGDTCFILGGGHSLNNMDLSLIHDKRVIGVNNAYGDPVKENGKLIKYEPRDWVDVCWFTDTGWWVKHKKWLATFAGLKVHCTARWAAQAGTKRMRRGKQWGIEQRNQYVSWNANSGASAINLAYHFGCKKVVLLGFDMHKGPEGQFNWHNDHDAKSPKHDPYKRFLIGFPHIHRESISLEIEIVNATPDSAIEVFPKVKLEDII